MTGRWPVDVTYERRYGDDGIFRPFILLDVSFSI